MAVREFRLPDLGEGLEDAEVVSWRVAEGDTVVLNQILCEVNTAKAVVEIPAPWEGVVERLHAGEGDVVKVGEPLISIRLREGVQSPEAEAEAAEAERPRRRAVLVGYGVEEEEPTSDLAAARAARREGDGRRRVRATPPVRKLARELGVDLAGIEGTGPSGRITKEDVLAAAEPSPSAVGVGEPNAARRVPVAIAMGEGQRIPVRGVRRMIAEKMTRSVTEIPHVTTFLTVDATHLMAFREEVAAVTGHRVSPLAIVVRALAEVVKEYPKLNATFDPDRSEIVLHGSCHVGIATDTPDGLLVPVVHDAPSLGVTAMSKTIGRLAEAARAGRSKPQELMGSTVTVTNVGSFGAEFGTPIINHPEAAVLALGVIEPRALVVDGEVQARPAVTLSLSFDHRVMDGAEAGRALKALAHLLENPFRLGALPR